MGAKDDRTRAILLEDLTFLADHGVGLEEAARRVGYASTSVLDKWLRNNGHVDLVRRLLANSPHLRQVS